MTFHATDHRCLCRMWFFFSDWQPSKDASAKTASMCQKTIKILGWGNWPTAYFGF